MKSAQTIDCVEMKNRIQRRLVRRRTNMAATEYIEDLHRSLSKSRSPAAAVWRDLMAKTTDGNRTSRRNPVSMR